jgi:sugar/nucleoside kinase (ribokinase family)
MILAVGDINVDITAPLAAHPAVGEDCLSPQLSFQCGGVGLNTAIALARLGVPTRLVSCTGNDWFGEFALERAAREGIDVSFVQRSTNAMTGLMFIAISPDGQRTFFGSRGASAELRMVRKPVSCLDAVKAVEIAGYAFLAESSREFAEYVIREARRRGIWVTVDIGTGPSRQIPARLMQLAREVDTVFANATEAEALAGQCAPEEALSALEQAGAREVVLKLGGEGCLIRHSGELRRIPPFAVNVLDTTGAGDAFTAGFMAARLWDWPLSDGALFANACGAAATMTLGAGERLPTLAAIEELLENSRLGSDWEATRVRVSEHLRSRMATAAISGSQGA